MHLDIVEICTCTLFFPIAFLILTSILISVILFVERFHGEYLGEHVAVKILRSEHLNDETLGNEFSHKVADPGFIYLFICI